MAIFDLLHFDETFDKSLFGNTINISESTLASLEAQKITFKQWQIDDISSNTTIQYYQNPLQPDLINIQTHLSGIITLSNTAIINYTSPGSANSANSLLLVCNSALDTISQFIDHTNRLSGVVASNNSYDYPDLESVMSIGRDMLTTTYSTDGIKDNTPMLGGLTSIFIGPYISANNTNIHDDYIYLNSTVANNNTSISNSQVNQISANVTILTNLLNTRRNLDIAFYRNSVNTYAKISTVYTLNDIGSLQTQLIDMIGTDDLKDRLSSFESQEATTITELNDLLINLNSIT